MGQMGTFTLKVRVSGTMFGKGGVRFAACDGTLISAKPLEVNDMCGIFAYLGNDLSQDDLTSAFEMIQPRGPDFTTLQQVGESCWLGFHRLAIMDPSPAGNQPFWLNSATLVCNGEIYNHHELALNHHFTMDTGSDCEVILHLYRQLGIEQTVKALDGVFAFVIVDGDRMYLGRDPIGIRPLFVGHRTSESGKREWFACSEMKGLQSVCDEVRPFEPGHWAEIDMATGEMVTHRFYDMAYPESPEEDESVIMETLREKLIAAVDKRMMSDRPLGCLVSGGVDSSLVAALVARHYPEKGLHTFTVGLDIGASDRGYARMVADYLGTNHHEVCLSRQEALALIDETIRVCESFDTTTIRASTMQLAVCRYISENTDIKVVFNGDVIDEASGSYVYFKNAPSPEAYQEETIRLMREIYLYDVLRTDRTVSGCGLEARLPFGDLDFVQYYMSIPPKYRQPRDGVEKYLLRKAFEGYLPDAVLWRPKEAFSDGCSTMEESWYSIIQTFVSELVSDEEFEATQLDHCAPRTKEELYYRRVFERHYPDRSAVIPAFWMPRWCGEDVVDPSARVLTSVYRPSSETVAGQQERWDLSGRDAKGRRPLKDAG